MVKSSSMTPTVVAVAWMLSIALVFALGLFAGIAFFRGLDRQDWVDVEGDQHERAELALILETLAGQPVPQLSDPENGRLHEDFQIALRNLLRVPDNLRRTYQARRIAANLNQRQVIDAIAYLQSLPRGPLREEAFLVFLQRWAELDARSSLAYVLSDRSDWDRESAVGAILAGWSRQDPRAAWHWVEERSASPELRQERHALILKDLAQRNPTLATELALSIPTERFRAEALRVVATEELKRQPPEAALARFEELEDGYTRIHTLAHITGIWARYEPGEAIAWAEEHPNPDLRALAYREIARSWGQYNPASTAEWVQRLPEGRVRAVALEETISAWIAGDGLVPAAQWLNQLDPHPDFDPAVQSATFAMMESDPAIALTWAHSITDPSESDFTVLVVAQYWMEIDPTTAIQHIQQDPHISTQTRQLLLGEYEGTRILEP